ncbi:MAG TPA: 2-amino-4-hydroxy-6-hydroxymethyldihydropteridine diphosphokinase [Candidatus Saccharimonadales bacterium]|nr:2-amino-4-hydroxy-6-hydroxymethyldihydropteridine diphosphokinase [Candidatus Saccharimonadales bacterium]
MTDVYLGLGSNVGDSKAFIDTAIDLLANHLKEIKRAPLYQSKAVGYTEQPDFLNTAIRGQTHLTPQALLAVIHGIETDMGRTKTFRWGPREIDIDIIFYGNTILDAPGLTIPHDSFRDRAFVLKPLADLDPGLIDPFSKLSMEVILKALPPEDIAAVQLLT